MGRTNSIFAINIRKLRDARGYSQGDLAILLGLNPSTISQWEGGRSIATGGVIDLLCSVFIIEPNKLFDPQLDTGKLPPLPKREISFEEAFKKINQFEGPVSIRPRKAK